MRAEVARERVVGDLAERPGELDAGRSATHDDEGHPRPPLVGIGLALGRLERDEDAAADLGRVLDGLEPWRERAPTRGGRSSGAARPWRPRACRSRSGRRRQHDLALLDVDARPPPRGAPACSGCGAGSSAAAGRYRPATSAAGRHLVEQRLEQVEVAPVDQRQAHLWRHARALLRGVQPGEPAADDDDAVREADLHGRAARGRYLSRSAPARTACAAASRATGTRNGEHET